MSHYFRFLLEHSISLRIFGIAVLILKTVLKGLKIRLKSNGKNFESLSVAFSFFGTYTLNGRKI